VKTPEDLTDHLANLAVWVWSIKDHLREFVRTRGGDPETVEEFVNQDPALRLCADIANRLKHGNLRASRSGHFPTVEGPTYTIGQAAVGALLFTGIGVEVDVSNPDLVQVSFKVKSQSGAVLGNALDFIRDGVAAWERLLRDLSAAQQGQ
jgi:hypothetical protein